MNEMSLNDSQMSMKLNINQLIISFSAFITSLTLKTLTNNDKRLRLT